MLASLLAALFLIIMPHMTLFVTELDAFLMRLVVKRGELKRRAAEEIDKRIDELQAKVKTLAANINNTQRPHPPIPSYNIKKEIKQGP